MTKGPVPRVASARTPAPAAAPRRAPTLLPALLAVAVALFFAWRPLLDSDFHFADLPLVRAAQAGPSLDHLRDHAVGFFHGETEDVLWQPGLHELADLVGTAAGSAPRGWFAAALLLHGVLTLVLFMVLMGEGAGAWFAAAGALCFALAPACAEVVGTPAAAFCVLPSLLLVLWSGRALLQWLQGARGAWIVAALLLLAYALAFDGSGVVLPLLVVGGVVVLGATRARGPVALLVAFALLAVLALPHLLFASRGAGAELPAFAFVARLGPGVHAARDAVAALVGVAADQTWVVGGVAIAWLGLLVSGSARTRFFLTWALLALLVPIPQLVRPGTPPAALAFLLPLVVGLVLWLADHARGRGAIVRVAAWLPLVALAAYQAWRLPPALATARAAGERTRGALESLKSDDLNAVVALAVDGAPPQMGEGLGALVAMFVPSAGGAKPVVQDLGLVRRPPLLFHRGAEFGANDTGVACFRWNEAVHRLVRATQAELIGGLTPQPRFALRFETAVVADRTAALQRIAANPRDLYSRVVLDAEPVPPFTPTSGARGTVAPLTDPELGLIELAVDLPAEGFLVLHEELSVGRADGREQTPAAAWLDAQPAPLLRADVNYYALRIAKGRHLVQVARAR